MGEERIELTIDPEPLKRAIRGINDEIEETKENATGMVDDVKERALESFNEVMGFMRATYLIISGVSRVMDQGMSGVFSSMYMVGMAAIATYKAIAAAMAASGVGTAQAIIMGISLTTATASLISILTGQRELSTKIRGVNMGLHGISALIQQFSI